MQHILQNVKICDYATRDALGYTDKFPRWAVAMPLW